MTWRTGRKLFRTLYEVSPDGTERLIGMMDTPELARLAAAAPDLKEALLHAMYRNHAFSPDSCAGCADTLAAISKAGVQ